MLFGLGRVTISLAFFMAVSPGTPGFRYPSVGSIFGSQEIDTDQSRHMFHSLIFSPSRHVTLVMLFYII